MFLVWFSVGVLLTRGYFCCGKKTRIFFFRITEILGRRKRRITFFSVGSRGGLRSR